MKKLVYSFVMQLLLAFFLVPSLSAQDYVVNTSKSDVKWEGSKIIGGGHHGTISIKSGSLSMADGMIKSAEIVIDMKTISNKDLSGDMKDRLEGHLKSDDFFGVDVYPEASFKMQESTKKEDGKYLLKGDFTIKGKTNSSEFLVTNTGEGSGLVFTGAIELDRSLYDVRYGSGKFFSNLGDKAINDIFILNFTLTAEK